MHMPNDVNVDGVVNITDALTLISMLLETRQRWQTADVNNDGNINIVDATSLINVLLEN